MRKLIALCSLLPVLGLAAPVATGRQVLSDVSNLPVTAKDVDGTSTAKSVKARFESLVGQTSGWLNVPGSYAATGTGLTQAASDATSRGLGVLVSGPVTISTAAGTVSVPVRFEGQGQLVLNTGGSVTLAGPLTAANVPIFAKGTAADFSGLTFSAKVSQVVPQWWGARGDGVTDDTAAIQAALLAAWSNADPKQNQEVFFPSGTYLVTQPNLLNVGASTYRYGALIRGAGWGSQIIFRPSVANAWLYDGTAVPGHRHMMLMVRDLRIVADGSVSNSAVNLFRQYGNNDGYPDQSYSFFNVQFYGDYSHPGVLLRIDGTVNGSENRFVSSRGVGWSSALYVTNPQAFDHYFIGCDWEELKGDIFYFSGGSNLTVIGGSIIVGSNGDTGGSMLHLDASTNAITGSFNFVGVRTEVRASNATLYLLGGVNLFATVNVSGAAHRSTNGNTNVELARMNANSGGRLTISDTELIPNSGHFSVRFTNDNGAASWYRAVGSAGTVQITNSLIESDLYTRVTWDANAEGGLFRTRGCAAGGTAVPTTAAVALDWDMTGPKGWSTSRNGNAIGVKSVAGFVAYWPTPSDPDDPKVVLPAGSIVKSIHVRKAVRAGDTNSSTYQLSVQNGDGTFTYGTSTLQARKLLHEVQIDNVNRYLASGVDQTIKIAAVAPNQGNNDYQAMDVGDMFIVEYY